MKQQKIEEQINSAPLYSFIGYLIENNKTGRNLHLTLRDIANNKVIDKDIIDRDNLDSIIFSDGSNISCEAITRDICYGFKLEIKWCYKLTTKCICYIRNLWFLLF